MNVESKVTCTTGTCSTSVIGPLHGRATNTAAVTLFVHHQLNASHRYGLWFYVEIGMNAAAYSTGTQVGAIAEVSETIRLIVSSIDVA